MERTIGLHPRNGAAPPVLRRLFHLCAAGSIPLIAIFAGSEVMIPLMASLCGGAIVIEVVRFRLPDLNRRMLKLFRPLLKESEDRRVTGATYVALSALACFLVFDLDVAVAALFFLALGDPAAAIVGSRMRGRVLGWRFYGKSPIGTLAFLATGLAVVGVLSGGGAIDYHWGFLVGVAVAGLIELAPSVIDDNLTIPLISGAVMTALV